MAEEAPKEEAPKYDAENVFAKIIDRKEECFKVFESRSALAILDLFPMVEGHTVFMPKAKGSMSFMDMPPTKAADFLGDLQKVARAVQKATGAEGINIISNNGETAGQSVFHPHFHIVPRFKDDGLIKLPTGSEKLTQEKAAPVLAKINDALNPPKPLKKAKWGKVSSVQPDSKGLNLKLKVLEAATEVESKGGKFWEVLCGDPSGSVVLSLRENQKDVATTGAIIAVRNAAAKMVQGHIRLAIDKWGKVEASDEGMEEEVDASAEKNVSATEYELVGQ